MIHEKIDGFCNSFKIKYMDLDRLFNGKLEATKGKRRQIDTVNIFISFESLYNALRRSDVEKYIQSADKKTIKSLYRNTMSDFINVAAHYREYFNRHKISTNIFYYYNQIPDDYIEYNNSAFLPEYRHHFVESLLSADRLAINGLVYDSIPFMELITQYLDHIYMVGTKYVESSLIPYLIMMENKFPSNMNIMITKDEYDYNYVNKNFLLITKYCGEPVVLTKYNIMNFLDHKNKCRDTESKNEMHPKLIPFIQAFLGDKKRSIHGMKRVGYKSIRNSLMELYKVGYIFNEDPETMSFNNLCQVLLNVEATILKDDTYLDDLACNYRAFDLDYQLSVVSKAQKEDIMDQLKNKYDYAALEELNRKYFEYYPLMLMELQRYSKKYDTDAYKAL